MAQSVQRLATRWTVPGSNRGEGEIFRTPPDRLWGPSSILHNGYRVSFTEIKRPGRGVNHPLPSSAEVKERVELYLYSPAGLSWPVLGRTLPTPLRTPNGWTEGHDWIGGDFLFSVDSWWHAQAPPDRTVRLTTCRDARQNRKTNDCTWNSIRNVTLRLMTKQQP